LRNGFPAQPVAAAWRIGWVFQAWSARLLPSSLKRVARPQGDARRAASDRDKPLNAAMGNVGWVPQDRRSRLVSCPTEYEVLYVLDR
jgi:hypothetical protein